MAPMLEIHTAPQVDSDVTSQMGAVLRWRNRFGSTSVSRVCAQTLRSIITTPLLLRNIVTNLKRQLNTSAF
jgi:hypothetical protein